MAGMTQKAYAQSRGVSPQAINKLVKSKKLLLVDGKIDPVIADAQLRELDPSRSKAAFQLGALQVAPAQPAPAAELQAPPAKVTELNEFAKSKAERERFAALRERLSYESELKLVIKREPVNRALFDAGRMMRDALHAALRNAAPQIAGKTDVLAIEDVLLAEADRVLASFSRLAQSRVARVADSS